MEATLFTVAHFWRTRPLISQGIRVQKPEFNRGASRSGTGKERSTCRAYLSQLELERKVNYPQMPFDEKARRNDRTFIRLLLIFNFDNESYDRTTLQSTDFRRAKV